MSGTGRVRAVTVTGVGLVLPVLSRVNTAYAYSVSAVSPVSVIEVVVGVGRVTAVPAAGVAGEVLPWARRTITAARSASPGLVQDRPMLVSVRVPTVRLVTGPGGVVSGAIGVADTAVDLLEVLPVVSREATVNQ